MLRLCRVYNLRTTEKSWVARLLKNYRFTGFLVDVAGIEPATPCLQIQKPDVDGKKKDCKE
jgi:hypothetical protein